jgi:hypothetical protein
MVTWQLTVDANDPARLVRFWAPLLGYEVQPPPEGFDSWLAWYRSVGVPEDELEGTEEELIDRIHDPTGAGPRIWFQFVPERKSQKNRFHFDLYPTGRDRSLPLERRREIVESKVAELLATGATVHRRFPDDFDDAPDPEIADHYFVVMQDPEGNEFCVA